MALAFITDILRGKTLGRALFNREAARHAVQLSGRVLDLGGGGASYRGLLPRDLSLTSTDRTARQDVAPVDFNEPLPFPDAAFEHVLLFNALYIAEDPRALLREIRRVLAPGGSALVASPYLQNEMREPHDYLRFTSEGLERLAREAGFGAVLTPYGERFSTAANLLHAFWYFSPVRAVIYSIACLLDRLIPSSMRRRHPAPIGYFCVLTKI